VPTKYGVAIDLEENGVDAYLSGAETLEGLKWTPKQIKAGNCGLGKVAASPAKGLLRVTAAVALHPEAIAAGDRVTT
jgi:hypothetical protein